MPSLSASQYPRPLGVVSMATTGEAGEVIEPRQTASPKRTTVPSRSASRYPCPLGEATAATTGETGGARRSPSNPAPANVATTPAALTVA